jgi:hypothetical protein
MFADEAAKFGPVAELGLRNSRDGCAFA